jgi:hypothetical protein
MKIFRIFLPIILILFVSCDSELPLESGVDKEAEDLSSMNLFKQGTNPVLFVDGLVTPEGMDFLGANLFIVESFPIPRRLLKIKSNGDISTLVEFINAGRLIDVVTDPDRGLFVSDLDQDKIYLVEFNGIYSTFVSGLNGPTRMALNSQGELFVTELGGWAGEQVSKISEDGTRTTVIVYDDGANIDPNGLDFDKRDNLYVVEGRTGLIRKFTINNSTPLPIDASTVVPFVSGLTAYGALNIDKKGNLWTMSYNELFRISPNGSIKTIVSGLVGSFNGVGISKSGKVFFSDYGTGEVFVLE